MKKNLYLLFVVQLLILSFNQIALSQNPKAPSIFSFDKTENISAEELRKKQRENSKTAEVENLLDPTVTQINFDDIIINSENSIAISPNRYAGVSFYTPSFSTWLTRSTSYSSPNSLIVGYQIATSNYIFSVDTMVIEFAQPSKDVSFFWGRDSYYNIGQIDIYENNNQYLRTINLNLGQSWNGISLSQYSQRIKKLVLRRPNVTNNEGVGHISIDNFQFTPITTSSPTGYFDGVDPQNHNLVGWSRDPDSPATSINVHCYMDGTFIGQTVANLPSPDLPPPGNHRFSMPVPLQYRDGNPHQANCYGIDVLGGDPNTLLVPSPRTIRFYPPVGWLDQVSSDGDATGWSNDPDLPNQPNTVHFYINAPAGSGTYIGQTTANIYRSDVGNHGFSFPIPAQYRDNQQHMIYAYGIDLTGDQNKQLSGSPKNFTLSPIVRSVTYEQLQTDDLPIDNNPNAGGGLRFFPDDKTPGDPIDRRKIRVKAQTSLRAAGIRVNFRNFDLDDPSADGAPIDPNGNSGLDNRGHIEGVEGTTPAGILTISPNSTGCQIFTATTFSTGISCLTDSNGVAMVDFTVTAQPGNNFTVVASTNSESYVTGITNDGMNLKDSSNVQIPVTRTNNNACENTSVKGCRTDMLTVWRRLHIEVDSLGVISGNKVEGNIALGKKVPIGNATINISTSGAIIGRRFENGRIIIGNRSFKVVTNTLNTVTIQNTSAFNVTTGQAFTMYDDDDFNDDDTALNGDEGDDVNEPDLGLLQPNDIDCPDEIRADNCNVLALAYIRPMYDLTGSHDEIPFSEYTDDVTIEGVRRVYFDNKNTEASTDFWTIYLLGGYQYSEEESGDPVLLPFFSPVYGVTDLDNVGSTMFAEVNRATEYEWLNTSFPDVPPWQDRPVTPKHVLAHEVGHLFSGMHDDIDEELNNAGLMDTVDKIVRGVYSDVTLDKIRRQTNP